MANPSIMQDRGYVTSEAVELDLPAATLPARMGGALIDVLVLILAGIASSMLLTRTTSGLDPAALQAIGLLMAIIVLVILPTTVETLTRGRSLGKWATGLRVVRDDAGPISMRHALTRALAAPFEIYFTVGVPAVVASATNRKAKRFGDMAAGTYVVRVRTKYQAPTPVQTPTQLEQWAHNADVATLPTSLAVAVRTLLSSAANLSPQQRDQLAAGLASDVMNYVAPPPPAGTTAQQLLWSVQAERRRRDEIRLERDDKLRGRVLGGDPLQPGSPVT